MISIERIMQYLNDIEEERYDGSSQVNIWETYSYICAGVEPMICAVVYVTVVMRLNPWRALL